NASRGFAAICGHRHADGLCHLSARTRNSAPGTMEGRDDHRSARGAAGGYESLACFAESLRDGGYSAAAADVYGDALAAHGITPQWECRRRARRWRAGCYVGVYAEGRYAATRLAALRGLWYLHG